MAKSAKEKLDVDGLLAAIRKKDFAPIYFLYGEEDYVIDDVVDAVLSCAVDEATKHFNCDIIYGSDADGHKIAAMAASYPMMADRRVVVVKDFERLADKEALEPYFENPSPTTVLVIVASHPDMRKKPFPMLRKHSAGGESPRLYDNQIPAWIESHVKKFKHSIAPQAAALLLSYVGSSLRELANEIEKLLIAIGDKTAIDVADVQRVVGVSREFTVFELANAVGDKNMKRAVETAERMIDAGESPVPMIAALTQHFMKLWKLWDARRKFSKDFDIAHAAGIAPFFLAQYQRMLQHYSLNEIEQAFCALARADERVKTSQGDEKVILAVVIAEIILNQRP